MARTKNTRRAHELAVVVGVLSGLASVVASRRGSRGHVGAQLAALRGPVGLANVAAACVGVVLGAWIATATAAVAGLAGLVGSAPIRVRPRPDGEPPAGLTLTTANVLVHNRRFRELAQRLLDDGTDVLVLQEVTPAHADVLDDLVRGRRELHLVAEPRDDYAGWATVSRYPVVSRGRIEMPSWPISWVVLDHHMVPIRVVNVHTAAPQTRASHLTWEAQLTRLMEFADGSTATVLAGDFNATVDHGAFRRLLGAGFSDAFDLAGRGWGATWPAHRFVVPLLRLDHVLVDDGLAVHELRSIDLVGSDHRGLRAVLRPEQAGRWRRRDHVTSTPG